MSTTRRGPKPIRESRFWQAYGRSRYAWLFYALLLTLVLMPLADMLGMPRALILLLVSLTLIAAVMPNETGRNRYGLLAFIVVIVIARLASERDDVPIPSGAMVALTGGVGLLAAASALRVVVTAKTVDSEIIYAALSTYLLAGIFFAQIHLAVESFWPGSYAGPSDFTVSGATYFSFVTLATLGYGDFLPRSDLARGIATFQVIGGQLYLAVMVARLIGAFGVSDAKS